MQARIDELEKNQNEIVAQTRVQEDKIKYLEKELRKRNIVVHGIQETEKSRADLEKMVVEILKQTMKITLGMSDIDFIRRLGSKIEVNIQTRPIQIQLTTMRKRNEILAQKKALKNSTMYITEDLTKEEREERKKLIPIMQKFRSEGKHSIIKNNILYVNHKPWKDLECQIPKNDKKRPMEESPKTNNNHNSKTKKANIQEEVKNNAMEKRCNIREQTEATEEQKHRPRSKSLVSFSGDIRKFIREIEHKDE